MRLLSLLLSYPPLTACTSTSELLLVWVWCRGCWSWFPARIYVCFVNICSPFYLWRSQPGNGCHVSLVTYCFQHLNSFCFKKADFWNGLFIHWFCCGFWLSVYHREHIELIPGSNSLLAHLSAMCFSLHLIRGRAYSLSPFPIHSIHTQVYYKMAWHRSIISIFCWLLDWSLLCICGVGIWLIKVLYILLLECFEGRIPSGTMSPLYLFVCLWSRCRTVWSSIICVHAQCTYDLDGCSLTLSVFLLLYSYYLKGQVKPWNTKKVIGK